MRAHYIQHVPFEGLGSIEAWLIEKEYEITTTKLYESSDFPKSEEIDFLIVMGGPMSVHDEKIYPGLKKEKIFIKNVIEAGKPTLGICLGSQLIAEVMGGNVYKNHVKEIGWFPIFSKKSKQNTVFSFPDNIMVFHWHGETYDLPKNAVLLATSEGCTNQAFQLENHVIGLQFHLETTPYLVAEIVQHCRNELEESDFVQREQEILSMPLEKYIGINVLMSKVLEYLHMQNKNSCCK